jgi:hypothetical protein
MATRADASGLRNQGYETKSNGVKRVFPSQEHELRPPPAAAQCPINMDGYFTPDINFTVGFTSSTSTAAAPSEMHTTTPNSMGSGIDSYSDAAVPAR